MTRQKQKKEEENNIKEYNNMFTPEERKYFERSGDDMGKIYHLLKQTSEYETVSPNARREYLENSLRNYVEKRLDQIRLVQKKWHGMSKKLKESGIKEMLKEVAEEMKKKKPSSFKDVSEEQEGKEEPAQETSSASEEPSEEKPSALKEGGVTDYQDYFKDIISSFKGRPTDSKLSKTEMLNINKQLAQYYIEYDEKEDREPTINNLLKKLEREFPDVERNMSFLNSINVPDITTTATYEEYFTSLISYLNEIMVSSKDTNKKLTTQEARLIRKAFVKYKSIYEVRANMTVQNVFDKMKDVYPALKRIEKQKTPPTKETSKVKTKGK
jgi:hypothetical protein